MKSHFLKIGLLIFIFSCNPKLKNELPPPFEGRIQYAYTYQSDSLDIDTLKAQRPHSGQMIFKDSMYKSVFVSDDKTETYLYDNATGIAFEWSAKDSIQCEDYKIPTDSVLRFEIIETDEKILGQEVKILEFDSKYATQRFYFSTKYKVAPHNYDKHEAYNWKFYMEKAKGGVPLKVEHIFKNFTMIGMVTRFEEREILKQEFQFQKRKLKPACLNLLKN